MFDPAIRAAALAYLQAKVAVSLANDALMFWAPRRPVPVFSSPGQVWEALSRFKYRNDPGSGAMDHFIHHERVWAELETGARAVPWQALDCDKIASVAYAALRRFSKARLVTILTAVDVTKPFDAANWGHHTIAVYQLSNGQCGAIDTNGHRLLPDLSEATLCRTWSDIYASLGYRYVAAVDVPYPW